MQRKKIKSLLLALFAAALLPAPAAADNWQARLFEYGSPAHIVGVDKKKRTFNFFEKKSPFRLRYSYPCVTGQLPGDKQQINDLRTPEGIYFVEYKIAHGLDFREYGGIAYTLNYPNPVDRLRGKTGHGIWIHSKGFELSPTRGCVAIGLNNIAEVGPHLLPGTPVVLAEELGSIESKDDGSLAELRELMDKWSRAWESRSDRLFDFYDPDAYSRATENFSLFRQNKERLFKILSFIKIYNREIHALEGPGYWVTWADQFYTASNLSTEGIRRLYWQKDKNGAFRIVGMEWTPRDVGMAAAFRKGTLVAEGPIRTATDASSEAPVAPRLDMPELAPGAPLAVPDEARVPAAEKNRGDSAAPKAIAANTPAQGEPLVPGAPPPRKAAEFDWGNGRSMSGESQEQVRRSGPAEVSDLPARQTPALQLPASQQPRQEKPQIDRMVLDDALRAEIADLVAEWRRSLQNRERSIESLYDSKDFNRLPASAGVPRGRSLNATLQELRRDFRQPWIMAAAREPVISVNGPVVCSSSDMLIATPTGTRQGVQKLWWKKDQGGKFRIVGSQFKPESLGLEANYLELVSDEIASTLEEWRKAWEAGNLDEYMSFYAINAMQQGRAGADNIRKQKELLWSRVKPAQVRLNGLRVTLDGAGARADMHQAYADSSGKSDRGVKTLFLKYDGRNWLIQREDWQSLPPHAENRL